MRILIKNLLPSSKCFIGSRSLPSNGPTRCIAPSLRLLVQNSLQAYCQLFSKGCACDVCDQCHLSSLWLGSHGDYSPTAPSLRLLILSGQCSCINGSYSVCSLFSFRRGLSPPKCPDTHFRQSVGSPDCMLSPALRSA
jgi:hypothetical protein